MVRTYNRRFHAHVGLLRIIALVSLVVALGLSAWARVKDVEPALEEYHRRLEQAAEHPGQPIATEE